MISLRVDVPSAVDFLRYCAGWATKIEGTTVELSMPGFRKNEFFGYTRREPVGVVGAIIPWNFPLLMAVWKVGPSGGQWSKSGLHRQRKSLENEFVGRTRTTDRELDQGS